MFFKMTHGIILENSQMRASNVYEQQTMQKYFQEVLFNSKFSA